MEKLLNVVLVLAVVLALTAAAGAQESLVVRDESEYAAMTMDELYEAALKEAAEGKSLVVYSETGSVNKSIAEFMEDFPGIPAEGTKYKPAVIAEKIPLEFQGEPYADVILTSDGTGEFYLDWYKKGYVTAYYQEAVEAALIPEFAQYGLPLSIEGDVWFYNTEAFPDGSPINNWWDVVEMKEDGTSVYTVTSYPVSNLNFVSMLNQTPSATSLLPLSDFRTGEKRESDGKAKNLILYEPDSEEVFFRMRRDSEQHRLLMRQRTLSIRYSRPCTVSLKCLWIPS